MSTTYDRLAATCDLSFDAQTSKRLTLVQIDAILEAAEAHGRADERRKVLAEVAEHINRWQDVIGWQPGESRNQLVCDIRDAVLALRGTETAMTRQHERTLTGALTEIEEFVAAVTHVSGSWQEVVIGYVRGLRDRDWSAWSRVTTPDVSQEPTREETPK